MEIHITTQNGTVNATQLIPAVSWSGDYKQAARTLDFTLLCSASDHTIPTVECPLGAGVQLIEGGEALFDGFIISRTKNTENSQINISCFDRAFYLKRNKVMKKYTAARPEGIIRELAEEFGFKLGYIEPVNMQISRNFLGGNESVYDIMLTAYTLAANTTGKSYHIGFRGAALYITEKKPDNRTLVIKGRSNLIGASTTESIENMVNQVKIYDANGSFVREIQKAEEIKLYGRLQELIKQSGADNKAAEAQRLLDEGGISQKITVDCLGNVANVAGGTVVVEEPYTGLYGLFYIDSDQHEWKRGQYYNKLVLNFKAMMDRKEAGSLPNANGNKTSGVKSTDDVNWDDANITGPNKGKSPIKEHRRQ
ncbi:hypothetical protein U6B65_12885 [Oscillospiraceae bacterium MB08-C2-2]|nr:hypothetical protein U6B65_12885 [Oscillospiraceae bacterium MB08-C2-2]